MARLIHGALSCSIALWLLVGCRGATRIPQPPKPPDTVLTTAEPVWQHLQKRRQAIQNFKGLARARVRTTTRKVALNDVVVVAQPFETIRLEGVGPFGQPLFLLIADRKLLSFYAPQEKRVFAGAASERNVARLLGIALTPSLLQYLLVGDLPLMMLPEAGELVYLAQTQQYRWEGEGVRPSQHYRIWFDPTTLLPVRLEMDEPFGHLVLQVQYDDFRQLDDVVLPYRITVAQPQQERRILWHYREVQINTEIAPSLFRMQVPRGTEHIDLEEILDRAHSTSSRLW